MTSSKVLLVIRITWVPYAPEVVMHRYVEMAHLPSVGDEIEAVPGDITVQVIRRYWEYDGTPVLYLPNFKVGASREDRWPDTQSWDEGNPVETLEAGGWKVKE